MYMHIYIFMYVCLCLLLQPENIAEQGRGVSSPRPQEELPHYLVQLLHDVGPLEDDVGVAVEVPFDVEVFVLCFELSTTGRFRDGGHDTFRVFHQRLAVKEAEGILAVP